MTNVRARAKANQSICVTKYVEIILIMLFNVCECFSLNTLFVIFITFIFNISIFFHRF